VGLGAAVQEVVTLGAVADHNAVAQEVVTPYVAVDRNAVAQVAASLGGEADQGDALQDALWGVGLLGVALELEQDFPDVVGLLDVALRVVLHGVAVLAQETRGAVLVDAQQGGSE
jgi:hypothetical protein